jgi:hypothetical protein
VAACAAPLLVIVLVSLVTIHAAGLPQDEGAIALYADRVLHGGVAYRDFETYYGPGMPWLLAGGFLVAGHHLLVERVVGVLLEAILAGSVMAIGLRFSWRQGAAGGLIAAVPLAVLAPPTASSALAATALAALALVVATSAGPDWWRLSWRFATAGVLAALAVTFRIDFALLTTLSILPVIWGRRRALLLYLAGGVVGAIPLAVHVAIVSPGTVYQLVVVDGLLRTSAARRLPLPPADLVPRLDLVLLLASVAVGASAAVVLWRGTRRSDPARLLAAAVLLSIASLPEALQRADIYHLLPAMAVPLGLLAVAVPILARAGRWRGQAVPSGWLFGACAFVTLAAVVASAGNATPGTAVSSQGRTFPLTSAEAGDAHDVLADVNAVAHPGQRLFVGPQDMRQTNYTATYLYFLLPQLVSATYYLEMEPLSANASTSHLAADVASADILVLTTEWANWSEPNQSSSYLGPALPNEVVANSFCLQAHLGVFRVYLRCDARR